MIAHLAQYLAMATVSRLVVPPSSLEIAPVSVLLPRQSHTSPLPLPYRPPLSQIKPPNPVSIAKPTHPVNLLHDQPDPPPPMRRLPVPG